MMADEVSRQTMSSLVDLAGLLARDLHLARRADRDLLVYNPLLVIAVDVGLFLLDCVFFAANATRLVQGYWSSCPPR